MSLYDKAETPTLESWSTHHQPESKFTLSPHGECIITSVWSLAKEEGQK